MYTQTAHKQTYTSIYMYIHREPIYNVMLCTTLSLYSKQKYALQMASMASNVSLAERGADLAIEGENSMNQLIDDDGNDYDSLPPRQPPETAQESTKVVLENTHKED